MAGDLESEEKLIAQAVAGEPMAVERLLLRYDLKSDRHLSQMVARGIPTDLQGTVSVDDVLQSAYVEVIRDIRKMKPQGPQAFYGWLETVIKHTLLDLIRAERTAKRGGGRVATGAGANRSSGSMANLLSLVAGSGSTPSQAVARREREQALQVALASLPDDYREAIQLHYLKGLPVREVAATMHRTERAVHMLCNRALKKLREKLGEASKYLSSR